MQENFKGSCRKHQKERKGVEMNTENQLQEQLDALSKMNLDELRDLCRKYFPGMKHCRSKILLRKKILFMIQAKA